MRDALLLLFLGVTMMAAIRYPFAAVLLWAWFTLAAPQTGAYGAAALPLNVPIALLALASIVYHGDIFRLRISSQLIFLVGFLAWLFVSQAASLAPDVSAIPFDNFWKVMLFVTLCAVATTDRLRFTALLWVLVMVMGFYGAKGGLYTILTFGQGMYFGMPNTLLGDNNHMGIALATSLPLFLFVAGHATHRWVKLGTWGVFALTVIAVLGTYSRGAFISLLVFGVLMWWTSRHKLVIGLAALIVGAGVLTLAPTEWTERMESISEAGEDSSFTGRVDAWVINTKLAVANPVTGAGLRTSYEEDIAATVSTREPRAAHSIYFEVLGGTGFVGLFLFLGLYASGVLAAFRAATNTTLKPWRRDFGRAATMSLLIFGVGGASVSMEMWEGYLLIIVLAGAIAKLPEEAKVMETPALTARERFRARRAARTGASA